MGRSTLISLNTTQAHIQTPSRMNKLLMLAFLVTVMGLMTTAAPQEDVEELEDYSEDEAYSMEEIAESGNVREAKERQKKKPKKSKRPQRPSKGSTSTERRNQKNQPKKSMRPQRPDKNKKPKSTNGERRRTSGNSRGVVTKSQCRSTDYTCLINAMTYLNLTKTQVTNYLKQQGRIVAANKTGEKKNGKKGIFAATAQRIIRSGGGNSAALSCQGSTTSNGAKNLTDLAALLNGCEAKVKAACSTENMPLPNITEVSACVDAKMTFKGMVDKCQMMKDNGTEACDCWNNDNFTALVTTIRGCKLSDDQKAVTAQLKNCKTEFSACKQAEDDGMKAMSSCATSKADLLASAKTLTENSAGIDAAKTKADSLANSTSSSRAAAACAEVITIVTEITTAVAANPENSTITTLTSKITSISSTLVCSDDEKTSLMTSSTDLASAKESVDGSLATIKEDLEIATGSAPTDEEISAATSSPPSTSATSARRNIVARHLLNRFNLN